LQQNYIVGFVFTDAHGKKTITFTEEWFEDFEEYIAPLIPQTARWPNKCRGTIAILKAMKRGCWMEDLQMSKSKPNSAFMLQRTTASLFPKAVCCRTIFRARMN